MIKICDLDFQRDLDLEKWKDNTLGFHMSLISTWCDHWLLRCMFLSAVYYLSFLVFADDQLNRGIPKVGGKKIFEFKFFFDAHAYPHKSCMSSASFGLNKKRGPPVGPQTWWGWALWVGPPIADLTFLKATKMCEISCWAFWGIDHFCSLILSTPFDRKT